MTFGPKTIAEAKKYRYKHSYSGKDPSDYQAGNCIASVHDGGRWPGFHQYNRKATVDGTWCKQHDPVFVKKKADEQRKQWDEERKQNAKRNFIAYHGHEFYDALIKIADGHNDARSLATKVLKVSGRMP